MCFEQWKQWIIKKCMIWYLYGYCYFHILQGRNPEDEYKRQCNHYAHMLKMDLQKSENGREILRLLQEQEQQTKESLL